MERMCEEGSVVTCCSTECSFNSDEQCQASNIDIGGECPDCEMYTMKPVDPVPDGDTTVSTCTMSQCNMNQQQHCMASGITLGDHAGHADCMTYRA